MDMEPRTAEIILEYQNYIEQPPVAPEHLYGQACSADGVTIESWRDHWLNNIRANRAKFGPFKDRGIGKFFGRYRYSPAIVAGAGPSLKHNASALADKQGIPLISCLHNFHFLEDVGADVDFYVTLDAGDITIEEVYEGGSKDPEWYWERTKSKKLLAYIGTHPKLLEKWQGEIYFFNAPVPDQKFIDQANEIEAFHTYVGNGGNVLGACFYIAKAIMGANPIAFIGADFSFSYQRKFHAWNSKYDAKLGRVLKAVDIYGNKTLTWQSYFNFKNWFDYIALVCPGIYVNCTEGGILGAYPDGNIMAIRQMELKKFIQMYTMFEQIKEQCEKPEVSQNLLLF